MLFEVARFTTFGTQHLIMLGIFVVGAAGFVQLGRSLRTHPRQQLVRRTLAVLITCLTLPAQLVELTQGRWDPRSSLPLQLCDLAWVVAVVALWTCWRWAVALNYFWGLSLSIQGVITPDLVSAFPAPGFLSFWSMHLLIIWSAVLLGFGLGIGPTWREYRIAVLVTVLWFVLTFSLNELIGSNYGFLNHKPAKVSALNLLGPWPWYLLSEVVIVAALWALMTWPWVRLARRRQPHRPPTAGSVASGRIGRS